MLESNFYRPTQIWMYESLAYSLSLSFPLPWHANICTSFCSPTSGRRCKKYFHSRSLSLNDLTLCCPLSLRHLFLMDFLCVLIRIFCCMPFPFLPLAPLTLSLDVNISTRSERAKEPLWNVLLCTLRYFCRAAVVFMCYPHYPPLPDFYSLLSLVLCINLG
jgi:hypothetical protein